MPSDWLWATKFSLNGSHFSLLAQKLFRNFRNTIVIIKSQTPPFSDVSQGDAGEKVYTEGTLAKLILFHPLIDINEASLLLRKKKNRSSQLSLSTLY